MRVPLITVLVRRQPAQSTVAALTRNFKGITRLPMLQRLQGEWIGNSGSRNAQGKLRAARSEAWYVLLR